VTPTLQAIFSNTSPASVDENLVKPHETAADPTGATWLRSNTAGSGPYVVASRTPGSSIVLKTAPGSWLPAPNYTEVDIRITSGSVASLLQSHAINFGEYGYDQPAGRESVQGRPDSELAGHRQLRHVAITAARPTRSARWATAGTPGDRYACRTTRY